MRYLIDLVSSLIDELDDNKKELLEMEDEDAQIDRVMEIVDSCVPVMTVELLDIAKSKLWLAIEEPIVMSFGGGNTAVGAIGGNINQHLSEKASEWLDKARLDTKK